MLRIAVSLLLFAGLSPLAFASTVELERAVALALHLSDSGPMPPEQRRELVAASLAYWRHFDGRIPRNSPADDEWLSAELDTTDMARIVRATNSPAYALRELAFWSTHCVEFFQYLSEAIGTDKTFELYLWLKATQCYSRADTGRQLRTAGLSDGTNDGAFKMLTFSLVLSTITGKLANTIVDE